MSPDSSFYSKRRPEIEELHFDFEGVRIASLSDPTLSTGATLFYFPKGAYAAFDSRGGSVGACETNLL
jgi:L-aminopeptidase/D-esterase-like protein